MAYNMTTDPERAAARFRAKQSMSPEEFAEWEQSVMRSNRGLREPVGPPKPKAPGFGDDGFTTALGRDLGFEKSEYKGAPVYQDDGTGNPTRVGERGPGIYVPKGGAFGGGDLNTTDVKQVAGFDTPQEALRKKFEPRLSKMNADEKEITYRKAKGMDIPRGLSARQEMQGLREEFDAYSGALKNVPGFGPSPAPKGSGFVDNVVRDLGGSPNVDLVGAAENAPAVAFNGKGPMLPNVPGASVLPQPGTGGGMWERFISKKMGLPYEDPRQRQREDEDRAWAVEERNAKRKQLEFDTKLKEFQLNQAMMTEEEKARKAVELAKIQRQIEEAKNPGKELENEIAMEDLKRRREGKIPKVEQNRVVADAIKNAPKVVERYVPMNSTYEMALSAAKAELRQHLLGQRVDPDEIERVLANQNIWGARPNEDFTALSRSAGEKGTNLEAIGQEGMDRARSKQSLLVKILQNPLVSTSGLVSSLTGGDTMQNKALLQETKDRIVREIMVKNPKLSEAEVRAGLDYELGR